MLDKLSIVVPCYNEEESLPKFYEEVIKVLGTMDIHYEVLFINDGSSDGTLKFMQLLSLQDPCVFYYSFSRNFGKEAAMFAGLNEASGKYVVLMDADLQHPPSLLIEMYHCLISEDIDCVGAKRMDRDGEGRMRNLCSRSFYRIITKMTKMDMGDGQGDYRMMSRQMVNSLLSMQEYNRYLKGMFSFVGFKTKWIPYENVERCAGISKWSMKQLFAYAMEGIFSFSTAPLMFASVVGTLCILFGILFLVFMLITNVTSLRIMVMLLLILGGLQLFFIGIVGEYLAKNYLESKHRPLYIIKESSHNPHN